MLSKFLCLQALRNTAQISEGINLHDNDNFFLYNVFYNNVTMRREKLVIQSLLLCLCVCLRTQVSWPGFEPHPDDLQTRVWCAKPLDHDIPLTYDLPWPGSSTPSASPVWWGGVTVPVCMLFQSSFSGKSGIVKELSVWGLRCRLVNGYRKRKKIETILLNWEKMRQVL